MRELLKKVARGVRDELSQRFKDEVVFDKGALFLAALPLVLLQSVSGTMAEAGSDPKCVNLPNTTEREKEALSLGKLLVDSLHEKQGRVRFIAPVCPDYSQESTASFYQTIGEGISPQAHAAIRAAKFIEQVFSKYGFDPKVEILIADTEDDIPEVMERCVQGDSQLYKARCISSVGAIQKELNPLGTTVVTTFSHGLEGFRQTQYQYEEVVRKLRLTNPRFDQEVRKLGEMRKERHSKILGRPESDHELTIRYMAQYASLGTLARRNTETTILLNYPTPNLPFYNAATFRDPEFSLSKQDLVVVPIVETVL